MPELMAAMHRTQRAKQPDRARIWALLAFGVILYALVGSAVSAAQVATPENHFNDELMRLQPDEQASKLADHLGVWCIGTKPFFMGMTKTGKAKGYAYWSVTCAGSGSYMIQITPSGQGSAAIDCETLKQSGEGRECYKAF
jgi:hypothetical protein